ncbi:hypothetical protein CRYUN_Cryun23aG0103100 [Craigia yunnanensis]
MSNNAGGGGIEGAIMLGGALAIAVLIAAFTIKKVKRKDSNEKKMNLAAIHSCRKEKGGTEGLRFILHDSSSTLHQNSCCTNHGTSKIGITQIETYQLVSPQSLITSEDNTMQFERKDSVSGHQEIPIHDIEQESIAMTGNIEEISRPVSDHRPMNVVENESNDSLVMETIEMEIEDEAVDADAEQPAEEISTLQSLLSSVSSTEEAKSSFSTGEEDKEEHSLMQSSFSTEEDEEEYSPMRSSFSREEEDEEEYSPIRPSFSTEEEDEEEESSPIRPSFSTEEDDEEENSAMESSFSTEEEEEEEEEDSPLQSSFSTEEDENGENVTEMEEESSEGTWSSSTESNMEAIWPAEIMGVLSPESKEINISHLISVKKFEEKDTTAKIENYLANEFDESGSNDGKSKKENQVLVVMNDKKEHSAKRQNWVWLGLVLLLYFCSPIAYSNLIISLTVFLLFFP